MTPERADESNVSATSEVAVRLRLAATRLSRLLRQQADTGLTPTKLAHLATIMREGPMSLGDLAAREQVSAPTVTKVVRGLEEHGLVTRDVDTVDARVTLVRVTAKGAAAIDEIRTRKDLWLTQRLAELPAADFARVADAVGVLEELTDPNPEARS